ncbi:MAG: lectin like domain-containing protein, partial [Halobacteriota archaeon]|nr:lectin like domain-containing protein [Halobacteriota archaeon]
HDEYGWQGTPLGYTGSTTAYGGVRYTPSEDLVLSAIDFWAVQPQAQYEITLFDTLNDLDGGIYSFGDQLGVTQSGTTDEQGYYSIILDTPVEVTSGNDFIVQIKFTTPNLYPLPIDYASNSAFSCESYISPNGVNFKKPSSYGYPYDIGIRARGELAKVHNLNTIEDFITIQEAIDDSDTTSGHIIELDVGTYSENIVLSKSVTLRSSSGDPTDTIINAADPAEHLIKITTDDVNIGNLTLKGATSANKAGIFADGVDLCRIENNNITDNYYGIYLYDSSSNYLKLNLVSGNINSGFYLTGGSTGNEIFFNNIYANSAYGFVNNQSSDVDATQNWWGTTVNDTINASIYDHYDDSSLGEVIYIPKQSSYIHAPVPEVTTMISLLI